MIDYNTDLVAAIWATGGIIGLMCSVMFMYIGLDEPALDNNDRLLGWFLVGAGGCGVLFSLWFIVSAIGQVI